LQDLRVLAHNQVLPATGKHIDIEDEFKLIRIHFRKGGPLAVTDANLLLGRLIPDYFPKIFGKSENEPLDAQASRVAFEKVANDINESHEINLDLDEIVYGLVQYSLFTTIYAHIRG